MLTTSLHYYINLNKGVHPSGKAILLLTANDMGRVSPDKNVNYPDNPLYAPELSPLRITSLQSAQAGRRTRRQKDALARLAVVCAVDYHEGTSAVCRSVVRCR